MHYTNILIAVSSVHCLSNYLAIASTPPPPARTTNHHCDRDTTTTCSIQQTKSTVKNILGTIQRHQNLRSTIKDVNRIDDNERPYVCISFAQTINGHIATTKRRTSSEPSTSGDDGDTSTSSISASTTTADGKVSTVTSSSSSNLKLSSPESFLLTHALRSKFDAIFIGGNTLLSDNPRLNNRLWRDQQDDEENGGDQGEEPSSLQTNAQDHISSQPIPVVLDTHLNHVMTFIRRDPIVSLSCAKSHPFVIFCCSQQAYDDHHKEILEYCARCNVCIKLQPCQCNLKTCHLDIKNVLYQLRQKHGIQSIMVEGGASILSTFLVHYRYLVDCICITICPKFIAKHGLNALTNEHGHEELEDLSSSFIGHWCPLGPDCIYLGIKTHDPIESSE